MPACCIKILLSHRLSNVTNNELEKLTVAKKVSKNVQSETLATKRQTTVLFKPQSLTWFSPDTAFVDAQHYTVKSVVQIQQNVAVFTVSRSLKRVKTVFEDSRLNSTVNHNETIYEDARENGIEPYPTGGRPFDVEGGYPPKSHDDCMPCELINDRLKENARRAFERLRKKVAAI